MDLLQVGHLHTVFSSQPSFHKLLTHLLTLELDTLPYLALDYLIHIMETQKNILACKPAENEDDDELFITFPKEHTLSEGFEF